MIRILLCLLIFAECAFAKPTPTPRPSKPIVKGSLVCRTKQQDLELRDWIVGIQNEAHKAKAETVSALASQSDVAKQLELSKQDATNLANENAKAREVLKRVNAYWGIGAFGYGIQRLSKHLFIFAGVIIVLGLLLWILSMTVFPAIGPLFRAAMKILGSLFGMFGTLVSRFIDWVASWFKKKPAPPISAPPSNVSTPVPLPPADP